MHGETCGLCVGRKAKRACPALSRRICPVCCATKRLTEIPCPADCGFLANAQAHPAAAVRRQRARDARVLSTLLGGLSESQARLLWALQGVFHTRRDAAVPPLVDVDVAEAARALVATLETAARGIVYEHEPQSLSARRLVAELKSLVAQALRDRRVERDAAVVLGRIAQVAANARSWIEDSPTAYLDFLGRVLKPHRAGAGRIVRPSLAGR